MYAVAGLVRLAGLPGMFDSQTESLSEGPAQRSEDCSAILGTKKAFSPAIYAGEKARCTGLMHY